ncbi:hypothetical protein Pmani_013444 [Petrolisthes manimaculis]|uniref:CD80-like immunoglobulin C2-set domain-containing protein n=1 Tax=Petrolisthes manimaculis TaxID=1843537 RepID=A0AAE1PV78_9EUCA|nr:hypothetical protein Pmani_013444 [Petrolisthes manimaculis]
MFSSSPSGLPKGGPILEGIRTRYNVGEWVDLTCTTHNAKPAPILSFILNDMPAPLGWVDQQTNITDSNGLTTSTLRLRFRLTGHVVARGGMAGVSCHALIPGVYTRNSTGIITTTAPHHASSVRGTAVAPHQGYRQDLLSAALLLLPSLLLPALTHA